MWLSCFSFKTEWISGLSVWLFPAWSTTPYWLWFHSERLMREHNKNDLVRLQATRSEWPYSMVMQRMCVYIHVLTCLWCVAFVCVRSGYCVHREARRRLAGRSRAYSWLTGVPSSHGRERRRQVGRTRYKYVPHQSWERETETGAQTEVWWQHCMVGSGHLIRLVAVRC